MNFLLFRGRPTRAQPGPGGLFGSPTTMFFIIGLMLLFWVVVILPMNRRQKKEQENQLASLKRGAKILTNAGIVGTVVTAKDGEDEIVIRPKTPSSVSSGMSWCKCSVRMKRKQLNSHNLLCYKPGR